MNFRMNGIISIGSVNSIQGDTYGKPPLKKKMRCYWLLLTF